jgi:hypothetical protein
MSWTIAPVGRGSNLIYSQAGMPSLDLRFAETKSLNDFISSTNLITFTRASNATFIDSNGLIQTATTDVPRFDHNPATGESLGLLVEEQRVNLLLNSETLATQTVTVAAAAHTLSFYGTGSVVLSGAHSATVNGTGAHPTRTTLTFTPTAGSLTLTVTGTVQYANLEAGAFATSWIPTTGSTATRSADVASISGSNFSSWFPSTLTDHTFFVQARTNTPSANAIALEGFEGTSLKGLTVGLSADGSRPRVLQRHGVSRIDTAPIIQTQAALLKYAVRTSSASRVYINSLDSTGVVTTQIDWTAQSGLSIGSRTAGAALFFNNHIRRIVFWPQPLSDLTLQTITQP